MLMDDSAELTLSALKEQIRGYVGEEAAELATAIAINAIAFRGSKAMPVSQQNHCPIASRTFTRYPEYCQDLLGREECHPATLNASCKRLLGDDGNHSC